MEIIKGKVEPNLGIYLKSRQEATLQNCDALDQIAIPLSVSENSIRTPEAEVELQL